MPTTVTSSISLSGTPDFSTPQAWEDAAPANLVTADQIWRGEISLPGDNFTGATTVLTVAGSTTDATRYKELTTASGASFRDHADAATNALTYDSTKGCSMSCSGGFQPAMSVTENYFRFSNIQVETTSTNGSCLQALNATNLLFDNLICKSVRGNCFEIGNNSKARNCLAIQERSAATSVVKLFGSAGLFNCSLVVASDVTAATNIIDESFFAGTIKNCALFGASNTADAAGATYTTCYGDDSTPPTGVTNTAYSTSTGAQFEGITLAAANYRIKTGSSLKGAGTIDATEAPADIFGTLRTGSNDVGCHQFVAPGGGISIDGTPATIVLSGQQGQVELGTSINGTPAIINLTGLTGDVSLSTDISINGTPATISITALTGDVSLSNDIAIDGVPANIIINALAGEVSLGTDIRIDGIPATISINGVTGELIASEAAIVLAKGSSVWLKTPAGSTIRLNSSKGSTIQ